MRQSTPSCSRGNQGAGETKKIVYFMEFHKNTLRQLPPHSPTPRPQCPNPVGVGVPSGHSPDLHDQQPGAGSFRTQGPRHVTKPQMGDEIRTRREGAQAPRGPTPGPLPAGAFRVSQSSLELRPRGEGAGGSPTWDSGAPPSWLPLQSPLLGAGETWMRRAVTAL